MKRVLFPVMFALSLQTLMAQEPGADSLQITPGDAYIRIEKERGLHLYIKKKPGLESILLTESSADPKKKTDSFALRSYDWYPENGNERRLLNGEFIPEEKKLYFLVDSTPEPDSYFGEAFHVLIPFHLTYGYEWSRQGQLEVTRGTWLNIRTFNKPYADYTGKYQDNPFVLSMKELPEKVTWTENQIKDFNPVETQRDMLEEIRSILSGHQGNSVELVLVIDTTISMKDDIAYVQKTLIPMVREIVAGYKSFRIGIVLYRDYKEAYLTREFSFTGDLEESQSIINGIGVSGGRDLEEAVYEGIYSAVVNYEWTAEQRIIIQIGDALPHKEPRGKITRQMVLEGARLREVTIYPILLPQKD